MITTLVMVLSQDAVRDFLERAEAAGRERGPFAAAVAVEAAGRGDGAAVRASGRVRVGRDAALLLELGATRTLIRGDEALTREGRKARSAPAGSHPLDLVRRGLSPRLTETFQVSLIEEPFESLLPEAVTDAEGKPVEPRPARGGARRRGYTFGSEEEALGHVLLLFPRDEEMRRRWRSVRLGVDPETFRIERLAVEMEEQSIAYVFSGFEDVPEGDLEIDR